MKKNLHNHPGLLLSLMAFAMMLSSCHHNEMKDLTVYQKGWFQVRMIHWADEHPLVLDSMIYTTSLGNHYMVSDLQYFLSGISLHQSDGEWITVPDSSGIHYFDARDPDQCNWGINRQLPAGTYDSLRFIFGLDERQNRSNRFPNPPERDMFWPEILGGGYHYMKMNLKWKNDGMQETMPFMFHLGIGQVYSGTTTNTDSIIGYVQNYFPVTLPAAFKIEQGKTNFIDVYMMIDRWFDSENAFDFSRYPMGIMQNQEGMFHACQNGRFAFIVPAWMKIGFGKPR